MLFLQSRLAIVVIAIVYILSIWIYKRAPANMCFIRTGFGGTKVCLVDVDVFDRGDSVGRALEIQRSVEQLSALEGGGLSDPVDRFQRGVDLELIRDQRLQEPILRGFRPELYRFRNP